METLRTLISGFLGLVILVRCSLVTMFLSWTTQTGCRIHRTYVSLVGSGEGRHTTHLLKCVLLLSTSQTDWKQSSDVLSDISFDILSDISSDVSSHILSDISFDILSAISCDIFSDISFELLSNISSDISFWHIFSHAFWHIFWHSFWHIKDISFHMLSDISSDILSDISKTNNIHDNFVPVKRQFYSCIQLHQTAQLIPFFGSQLLGYVSRAVRPSVKSATRKGQSHVREKQQNIHNHWPEQWTN